MVFPFKSLNTFMIRLRENFGLKLVTLLSSIYFFEEGIIFSLIYLNQLPFYKDVLKINETQYQIYFLIATSPWSMKAFNGVVSDLFPLLGFHKTSYMVLTGFLSSVALSVLATIRIDNINSIFAPSLIFVVMLELSVLDLLSEGLYSKILFEKKIEKGDIITWVWICRVFGQLVGGSIVGTFVTHYHPQNVFWICLGISFPTMFLLLAGFLGESYTPQWYKKFMWTKFKRQWRLFTLALTIFFCSVGIIVVNVSQIKNLVFSYSIGASVLLIVLGYFFLPLPLAKCNFYIFIQEALYLRIMGALDYFYTADSACVPDGPHFGMTFYLTITQIIGCVSGIIGILVFQRYTKSWTFRFAFLFSIFARVLGSIFDIIIVNRTNIKYKISDRAAFIFGDAIIMDMAFMLAKMPAILLTARLVHRDFESTIYAILAGYHDFGKNVAISVGTTTMMHLGIDFDKRPCHYEKLPLLVLIAHTILPLLAIPFVYLLIPNIRMSDTSAFEAYKIDQTYGNIHHFDEEDSEVDLVNGKNKKSDSDKSDSDKSDSDKSDSDKSNGDKRGDEKVEDNIIIKNEEMDNDSGIGISFTGEDD